MDHKVKRESTVAEDLQSVGLTLVEADKYKVRYEVVLFALYAMKDDPTRSIAEVMQIGLSEWIK